MAGPRWEPDPGTVTVRPQGFAAWSDGGIYEWRIAGLGVYVGRCTSFSRPRRAYWRKVRKILGGVPHRHAFRPIHRALACGIKHGRRIELTMLEVLRDPADRARREREIIRSRRMEALDGGLRVLNVV